MPRHRKFQVVITSGVLLATFMALVAPHLEIPALFVSTLSSLIWIWE